MLVAECERLSGPDVHLRSFNDMANPEWVIAVAKQVIAERFDVVIDHFNSFCSLVVKDLYREAKIGFISPLSTNPELNFEQGGAMFCPSDDEQLQTLADEARETGKLIYVLRDGSPYSKHLISYLGTGFSEKNILDDFEQFPADAASNSIVFLAGAHCNLMQPHKALRRAYPSLTIVGCDDCCIDEYIEEIADLINEHDFVMGQAGGHSESLYQAVQYLNEVIRFLSEDKTFFDSIGQNTPTHQFKANGRVASAVWQLLPFKSLIKGLPCVVS